MASNHELILVAENDWLGGFANLASKENRRWWKTRRWLVQSVIWLLIVNGLLVILLWISPNAAEKQGAGDKIPDDQGFALMALTTFISTMGMAPAIGTVIIGQEAMISEKKSGTAAWVLSKPVARSAIVLSKIACNALGILVTMVIVQGVMAYFIIWLATGVMYPLTAYIGALAMAFLSLLFYLTLTIMLGTISNSRGLSLGVSLFFILGYVLFSSVAPWLGEIMPWNITAILSETRPALALALVLGQPLPTITPLVATILWSIVFTGIALWRFRQQEF